MSDKKESYYLPTGAITHDSLKWEKAWGEIAEKVLEYYPGFRFDGFSDREGKIYFNRVEQYSERTANFIDEFCLPLRACFALINKEAPKDVTNYHGKAEMACYDGDLETLKYLIENKKIDLSDKKEMNAMIETAKVGQQVEVFKYLETLQSSKRKKAENV
jgi:hypothetical protein